MSRLLNRRKIVAGTQTALVVGIGFFCVPSMVFSQSLKGTIPRFPLWANDLVLTRPAQPNIPFDKTGRKFAVLGFESGTFEVWAYPLKLFRNAEISFLVGSSTRPIPGREIVRWIDVRPEITTLTYVHQSFTVKAHFLTPIDEPGALILIDVDAVEPVTLVFGFLPVLEPMWPAGLGGQFAYWDDAQNAYVISESTWKHHALFGSPSASGISYTPAHMLSDVPNEFKIIVSDPSEAAGRRIVVGMAGGQGSGDSVSAAFRRLVSDPQAVYERTRNHYQSLRQNTLRIVTPDSDLNLAFEWAKVSYDNLVVTNPSLGTGLVAGLAVSGTSGRPGFGWFFGGDAFINAMPLIGTGAFETVKQAMEFLLRFQREDGKMPHEISQAAADIDWFNRYHYGYIHGDTSPYFLAALLDYVEGSGDQEFVRTHWGQIRKAYDWCLSTDANQDGLMDNRKAGLGAVEYGKLTGGVETDILLASVWARALKAMEVLAPLANEPSLAKKAGQARQKAERVFEEKFWDDSSGFYAYGFNKAGERVKEFSAWASLPLLWGLGRADRACRTLDRLASAEMMTDWGVRYISDRSSLFEPLNYNYGAVWPFMTGYASLALFCQNRILPGLASIQAVVRETFSNQLGCVNEVFAGDRFAWPQESVSHQGFSTCGLVLPLIRGLLGLEGSALDRTVAFSPRLPADWEALSVVQFRIGGSEFSFRFFREKDLVRIDVFGKGQRGFRARLSPVFGPGTDVQAVWVNGLSQSFEKINSDEWVQAPITMPVGEDTSRVEWKIKPTVEILPMQCQVRVGDPNRGLKILSVRKVLEGLELVMEGCAGESYAVRTTCPERIRSVLGGERTSYGIDVEFGAGPAGTFSRKTVAIGVQP